MPQLRLYPLLLGALAIVWFWLFNRYLEEPHSYPQDAQAEVEQAFVRSWEAYRKYAYGQDVYLAKSRKGKNIGPRPIGWIIIDSLDTMMIMGLQKYVDEARSWIANELDFNVNMPVSVFETTIRVLAGLLSAYNLSKDQLYLTRAKDLGERLFAAYGTSSGLPVPSVNLASASAYGPAYQCSTAEVTTLQLELKYLAVLTGEKKYWDAAQRIMQVVEANHVDAGLVPIHMAVDSGKFAGKEIRLGSRGDSYYEYLLKQYLQTNKTEIVYQKMYEEAVEGIRRHLVRYSEPGKLTFIGELPSGIGTPVTGKMDHLVCFAGGMFALGATDGKPLKLQPLSPEKQSEFELGEQLTHSCVELYLRTATGLAPEIAMFNMNPNKPQDFYIKPQDAHNLQRPETVESLFILWRLTGDQKYRVWGWKIFKAFEKFTRLPGDAGYACISDVENVNSPKIDNMESFWLAETLKYLWLLFDDSGKLPLDQIVFNTEAHPFPIISSDFGTWDRP